MKIIKSNYDYELEARNQLAHLKNRIIQSVWDTFKFKPIPQDEYYEINRGIGAAIDDLVVMLGAEFSVDYDRYRESRELSKEEAVHRLSRLIADELMKSEDFFIQHRSNEYGNQVFRVSIPFIKTVLKMKPNIDASKKSRGEK